MQIELIGCTSAGKSTLARTFIDAYREAGVDAMLAEDFVLELVWLGWARGHLARTLLVDLCALVACLATWRQNRAFFAFGLRTIVALPAAIGWFEKTNLARNVFKKIGVDVLVRHYGGDRQVIIVDEGTLHAAHNLFVHVARPASHADLALFATLVPLPDVAVYVTQSEQVLVERTLRRGHRRVSAGAYDSVVLFVRRAMAIFDQLVHDLTSAEAMVAYEAHEQILVTRAAWQQPFTSLALRPIAGALTSQPAMAQQAAESEFRDVSAAPEIAM